MSRNPARSRPLSRNVKRLMKEARTSPENPNVVRADRSLAMKDLVFCDLQGSIFMSAVDKGLDMEQFAPLYMKSQLSAVIDFHFFHPGAQDPKSLPEYLQVPVLLKSPNLIVDVLLWIEGIVSKLGSEERPRAAVIREVNKTPPSSAALKTVYTDAVFERPPTVDQAPAAGERSGDANRNGDSSAPVDETVVAAYEYAYWLGYIYRYESLLHEESSRMVYAVLEEPFMREQYARMGRSDRDIADCASQICRDLDQLIVDRIE